MGHCSCTVYQRSCTVHALKNIKNRSHGTIHTFKNYFDTVLSVFSFNNNKLNPNGPSIVIVFIMLRLLKMDKIKEVVRKDLSI